MKKLIILFFLFSSKLGISQKIDNQQLYDSLIVNTWKTESVKIGGKTADLNEEQKASRMIFHKNHTSENRFNDLLEKGKWIINAKENTLKIYIDMFPQVEPHLLKIILLTKDKLILNVKAHDSEPVIQLTCVPEN
jgi:hypothetical protein